MRSSLIPHLNNFLTVKGQTHEKDYILGLFGRNHHGRDSWRDVCLWRVRGVLMFTVIYKTYMGGVESYVYRRFTNRANATTFARKTGGTIEKA